MAYVLLPLAKLIALVTCYLSAMCHQGQAVSWEPQLQEPQLRQMLMSTDGQHIIVSGRSHVYVLNSTTLELINSPANIPTNTKVNIMIYDGTESENTGLNQTNGNVITCVNTSANCDVRSVSNVSVITGQFSGSIITDGAVAFIANTQKPGGSEKFLFIGCPHNPLPQTGRCIHPGITWFRGYDATKLNSYSFASYLQTTTVLTEKYVSGFHIGEYRIFFSIQRIKNAENVQSRVAQVCQKFFCANSDYMYSTKFTYVDMVIKCGQFTQVQTVNKMSFDGNDVFIAVFSNGSMSAVCVYPLETMKAKFVENIKNCYRGRLLEPTQNYFDPGQQRCSLAMDLNETINEPDDFFLCNKVCLQANPYVIGQTELTAEPTLTFNYNITAVTLVTKRSKVIAFLGSSQGHLIKAVVYPFEHAAEIQQPLYNFERAMIQQDMYTSLDQKHIYFFTQNKIYKQPVEFCSQFDTCGSCLQNKDPYCGWCFLHNRCSTMEDCSIVVEWINPSGCPSIQSINPSVLSDKSNDTLSIVVSNSLPTNGVSCIFHNENTGLNFTEPATVKEAGKRVECAPRNTNALQNNIKGFLNVSVDIVTNKSSSPALSGHFMFYKCETFERCSDCIAGNWTCKWCTFNNVCIDRSSSCTPANTEMDGSCPMIEGYEIMPASNANLTDKDGIFYFSRDRDYEIRARGSHLPEPRQGVKYQCELKGNMSTAAVFQGTYITNKSYVTCDLKMEKLSDISISDGELRTSLQVSWGRQGDMKMVDGTTQPVSVYECKDLVQPGTNCGQCKSYAQYQPHYQCVWCQNGCIDSLMECNVAGTECGCPEITDVYPLCAHKDAVTRISITGVNLGSTFNDTIGAVTIAGRNCSSVKNEYVPGVRIVCDLDPSRNETNGTVVVMMWNSRGNFTKPFSFRLPKVTSIEPELGPRSGGTLVTLQGVYLDTGFRREVKIGNQLCDIDNTHVNRKIQEDIPKLLCKTRAWKESTLDTNLDVSVTYDGEPGQIAERVGYRYVEDPVITKIEPRKSFKSGGRNITIEGIRLHAIQKPKIYAVISGTKTSSEECSRAQNETASIVCPSPRYVEGPNRSPRNRRSVVEYPASFGFEMDHVASVSADQLPSDMKLIVYYPDPTLENMTVVKNYGDLQGNHLSIKGHNLMVAATEADVIVRIGCDVCNITSMSKEAIYCEPPKSTPLCSNIKENMLIIKVKIGYLERDVGMVKVMDPPNDKRRQEELIVACTVVSVLVLGLLITCIVLGVMYKRGKIMKKENQGLAYKMDKLEGTYRTKCREEFAALQTVMLDLTSDLEGGNVLFRDYDVYAIKTLFSSQKTDPLLSPPKVLTEQSQMAMDAFRGLLRNRQFLLMLIKSLEKQNSFTIHDKSNVASILMVLNHDNMEYITSIMMTLLTDLIDKNIAANTPKLLLRGSECVSEKLLTHWLSICLYHYLKDQPGSHLFSLYKAIKIFTERGPIDYITNCGKYTLSEDRLITTDDTEINSVVLTLSVSHFNLIDNEKKEVSVQVLDCDTITQAKNKMLEVLYKNVPYSQRPAVHSTCLEIETSAEGVTARELLNDEDASSIKEGLWKKINTLQHYHVQDGARCQLLFSKEIENASLSLSGASPDSFIVGSFRRSKPVVRTISGSNFWHLTKKHTTEDEVKLSSDLFLPRLIKTKGTLQEYIDNLLLAVLSVGEEPSIIIKYLFDFLDSSASRCGITDPDVLHTWKCNSLLLRFWVNIIKNPEFVFDIYKPQIVDGCLSVIAQTMMDSCSTADLVLGPTSPSNKLLFAKDIPRFKTKVRQYFEDMKKILAVSDQELNSYLTEKVSQKFSGKFHPTSALLEMYSYTARYRNEICREMDNLEASAPGSFSPLTSKLEYIFMTMNAHK